MILIIYLTSLKRTLMIIKKSEKTAQILNNWKALLTQGIVSPSQFKTRKSLMARKYKIGSHTHFCL